MPELPEIETIRRSLVHLITGKKIQQVTVRLARIIQKIPPEVFTHRLQGLSIESIGRRGKYLLIHIPPYTLVSHLRMEGKYRMVKTGDPWEKHDHVEFRFTDGTALRYNDVRQFGTMDLVPQGDYRTIKGLATLGPEPIDEQFNGALLQERLERSRNTTIKSALLRQDRVAGLGNIYVDESLFRSGIHPERPVHTLQQEEYDRLASACKEVLLEGIAAGGASVRTYSSPESRGSFQLQIQVYGKKGEPCPRCHHPIERIVIGGRGTHFCPICQPACTERDQLSVKRTKRSPS
jgi:formamidopyrimidine-DNA glycosylase